MRADTFSPMFATKIAVIAEHLVPRRVIVALEPAVELDASSIDLASVFQPTTVLN